jgi:putative transposase
MPMKRHALEEIVSKLRQVDVMVAQGQPIVTAVKKIEVTEQSLGMNS